MKIIYCTKEEHVSKGASTASNIAERLFSTVTHDFNDYRKKLLPINLEGQIFFKESKKFWDVKTVAEMVNKTFEIIVQLQYLYILINY